MDASRTLKEGNKSHSPLESFLLSRIARHSNTPLPVVTDDDHFQVIRTESWSVQVLFINHSEIRGSDSSITSN